MASAESDVNNRLIDHSGAWSRSVTGVARVVRSVDRIDCNVRDTLSAGCAVSRVGTVRNCTVRSSAVRQQLSHCLRV